jgi:polyhydroxybutyrate depolymerase
MLAAILHCLALSVAPQVEQPPVMVDVEQRTIVIDGVERTYYLHVPPGVLSTSPRALVFVLHGYRGTAVGMRKMTAFSELADRKGFVVVYLQGAKNADGDNAWNSGISPHIDSTADDVKFVRKVAAEVKASSNVDSKRIYVTGLSNGGAMTHRLAAEAPDLFAAAGVVAGAVGNYHDGAWDDIAKPKGKIAIAIFHGKSDDNVLFDGGAGADPPGLNVRSVRYAVELWSGVDGCGGGHPSTSPTSKGETVKVEVEEQPGCDDGTAVVLYTLVDGEHQWPTVRNESGINGTAALWKFFAAHPRG